MTLEKLFLVLACFLFGISSKAQRELTDFIPTEDVYPKKYCKPGVIQKSKSKGLAFGYSAFSGLDYNTDLSGVRQEGKLSSSEVFFLKLKVPIINKCHFKLVLGYEYNRQKYRFDPPSGGESLLEPLDNESLSNSRLSLYALRPINSKAYVGIAYALALNGNYNQWINFDSDYRIHRAVITYGYKSNEDEEWGVGFYYKNGFRSQTILPFGFYNRTFNDRWGFESIIFSRIYGRYNFSKTSLILFGPQYVSRDFAVKFDDQEHWEMKWPHIDFNFIWQQRLAPWVWFEAKAAYVYNLDPTIEYQNGDEVFETNIDKHGFNLMFSIFITPTEEFLKSH